MNETTSNRHTVDVCYGFFCVKDPRDFEPDFECCTPKEISSWRRWVQIYDLCEAEDRKPPALDSGCKPYYSDTGKLVGFIDAPVFGIGMNLIYEEQSS